MATFAEKPGIVANSTSKIDAYSGIDPFSRHKSKMDALKILKIAENLSGPRQTRAMEKVKVAVRGKQTETEKVKAELIKIIGNGATNSFKYDALSLLSEMDEKDAFKQLVACIKKGGFLEDCAFVVLENLASKNDALKMPILNFLNHLIYNDHEARTETRKNAFETRENIGGPFAAEGLRDRQPLAEGARV